MKELINEVLNENTSLLEQVMTFGSDDDRALAQDLLEIASTEQGYRLLMEIMEAVSDHEITNAIKKGHVPHGGWTGVAAAVTPGYGVPVAIYDRIKRITAAEVHGVEECKAGLLGGWDKRRACERKVLEKQVAALKALLPKAEEEAQKAKIQKHITKYQNRLAQL